MKYMVLFTKDGEGKNTSCTKRGKNCQYHIKCLYLVLKIPKRGTPRTTTWYDPYHVVVFTIRGASVDRLCNKRR